MNRVTQAFSEVFKGVTDSEVVFGFVNRLAQNLHKSNQGFVTVKIMNKYLEDYATKLIDLKNPLPEKKHQFTEYIQTEFQLIEGILSDLANYLNTVHRDFLPKLSHEQIDGINERECFGKFEKPHIEHLKSRLDLIGNIIEESTSILTLQHLETMWRIVIVNNKIQFDH